MRAHDPKARKTSLFLDTANSLCELSLKELFSIRGDYKTIPEKLDAFTDYEKACKLMAKKSCVLSASGFKDTLTFARCFDNQLLECIKFKVLKTLSSADFDSIPAELYVKYMVLTQNVSNKRIENLFIDFFSQKTVKVNIEAIKYAWVISETKGIFTIKFVRILNDMTVQDIGPYFELKVEKEFFCGDELYEKAFEVHKPHVQKNVSTNATKDKIGKLYIDKQDLKEINLKKSRAYRAKDVK